eukprot:3809040-Amphidinium_carterae.1
MEHVCFLGFLFLAPGCMVLIEVMSNEVAVELWRGWMLPEVDGVHLEIEVWTTWLRVVAVEAQSA